jgi:hypothetical protein
MQDFSDGVPRAPAGSMRSGAGSGRTPPGAPSVDKSRSYTIIYQATDSGGNSAFATATVTVPLSERKSPQ